MLVPNLEPKKRNREYNSYTEEQRDKVVYNSLFVKGMTNRSIDEKILGLDSAESRGWQSMGILNYLGIKNPHKGIFIGYNVDEAINILTNQDFEHFKIIIDSLLRFKLTDKFPQIFDSWELLNKYIALKTVDKSTFSHFGTGIPIGIRGFFEIGNLGKNDRKNINIVYKNNIYKATIEMDSLDNPRSRLIWKANFRDLLNEVMPIYYDMFVNSTIYKNSKLPKIRFLKVDDVHFDIDFIYINEIEEDIKEEKEDNDTNTLKLTTNSQHEVIKEGKVKYVYGKQYERDSKNRIEAIKLHGTKCIICGFDFEKVYGTRGKGYIEIHHVNPLSSVGKETNINPKTDLVPVCSNCHKMIHRRKNKVLSIDEMKKLTNKNQL